jgi:hypothetical protein
MVKVDYRFINCFVVLRGVVGVDLEVELVDLFCDFCGVV